MKFLGVCLRFLLIISNPSLSRKMAVNPEPDSSGGFFLLNGSHSFPLLPVCFGIEIVTIESAHSDGFLR